MAKDNEDIVQNTDGSQQSSGIVAKDGRVMHPNSLANMEKGRFKPGDSRINRNGRPPVDNSWAEICRKVSAEIIEVENGEEISRRELFIRQCWAVIDDPGRDFRLKFDIFKELSSREEGRPAIKQEVEGAITAQNVIFLPAKSNENNSLQANYEVIDDTDN